MLRQTKFIAFLALVIFATSCSPAPVSLNGQVFIVTKGGANFKLGLVDVKIFQRSEFEAALDPFQKEVVAKKKEFGFDLDSVTEEMTKISEELRVASDQLSKAKNYDLFYNSQSSRQKLQSARDRIDFLSEQAKPVQERASKAFQLAELAGAAGIFARLPSPVAQSRTDADGKFALTLLSTSDLVLGAMATRAVGDEKEEYYWLILIPDLARDQPPILLSNHNLLEAMSEDAAIKMEFWANEGYDGLRRMKGSG